MNSAEGSNTAREREAEMEIRVRASAQRTSKGYSVDATFERTGSISEEIDAREEWAIVEGIEDFCLAHLKRLMGLLESEFPKEAKE